MAPPNSIACSVPDCDYTTPPGLTTYDLVTQHLALNSQSVHATAAPAPNNVVKARIDKQPRPKSKCDKKEHEFAFFSNQWSRYKRTTGITIIIS